MQLADFLKPELIIHHLDTSSRKRTIESITIEINRHHSYINADQLFDKLLERERLGSTALGAGIAIPHCRMNTEGIDMLPTNAPPATMPTIIGAFVSLAKPIDFDAIDNQPVDLLFVLVALGDQQQTHLDALAVVNTLLIDDNKRNQLRTASNQQQLQQLLLGG